VVDETGREGMARRAEKRLSERTERYPAAGGERGVGEFCVIANYCAHFIWLTRNSLLSSIPSFNVVDETGREGSMARRAERRLSERAGRYPATGGARAGGGRAMERGSGLIQRTAPVQFCRH